MAGENGFEVPAMDWGVTTILEHGSEALRFFDLFEVRYKRWVGESATIKSYGELHGLYYAQNGLDEKRFTTQAQVLFELLATARAEHGELNTEAQKLPSIWSGQSAANAAYMIGKQLEFSGVDIESVQKIHDQMAKMPDALRKAILPKAEMLGEILEVPNRVSFDGKSPEDVDSIISGAQGIGWSTSSDGDLLGKLQNIFTDLPWYERNEFITLPGGDNMEWLEGHCRNWLNKFTTAYEEKEKNLVDTCTTVNNGVRDKYNTLIGLFGSVGAGAYPCPPEQATPGTPQAPAGTPSGTPSGAPSGTPSGMPSGMPAGTNPSTPGSPTAPSGDNPLSALTELGTQVASSGLGSQLASGLSQLATSANEQITSTLEQLREQAEQAVDLDGDGKPDEDADGDGTPDGPGEAEEDGQGQGIELNGKEYKLEMGPDGQLRLVVSGEDGEPQNYKIEIGADGKPTLVPEESAGDTDSETGDSDTENPVGTGAPPGTSGAPKGTNSEDGEHQPQDYPAPVEEEDPPPVDDPVIDSDEESAAAPPPPPPPPVDTGAQLAEAGPL